MILRIEDDFDLRRIAESGQCFRFEEEADGAYRVIRRDRDLLIEDLGEQRFRFSCGEEEFRKVWHGYFDLGEDYRSIRGRIREDEDPFLARACEFGKGIRILRQDPWEMLISFIISQNKNIPAIRKCVSQLCKAAGQLRTGADGRPFYAFPTPEEILDMSDGALGTCRLGYRARYVKAAASDAAEGRLDFEGLQNGSEEAVIEALTQVLGVGVKVASCVSLFGFHKVDSFPVDVWVRRILEREYPEGYPKEKYAPYNGIYQQYMFYYYRERYGK